MHRNTESLFLFNAVNTQATTFSDVSNPLPTNIPSMHHRHSPFNYVVSLLLYWLSPGLSDNEKHVQGKYALKKHIHQFHLHYWGGDHLSVSKRSKCEVCYGIYKGKKRSAPMPKVGGQLWWSEATPVRIRETPQNPPFLAWPHVYLMLS